MLRPENQAEIHDKIKKRALYNLHEGITCTSWTIMQNMNACTRTLELPQGDGSLENEVQGNQSMAVALWLLWECIRYGIFCSLEHPLTSRVWRLPIIQYMLNFLGLAFYDFDQCAYCKRPDDWDPSQGDVRTLKSSRLISNNTYLQGMVRKCADVVKHAHRAVIGKSTTGQARSADAGAYPPHMAINYAACVRTPWLSRLHGPDVVGPYSRKVLLQHFRKKSSGTLPLSVLMWSFVGDRHFA